MNEYIIQINMRDGGHIVEVVSAPNMDDAIKKAKFINGIEYSASTMAQRV